MVQLINVGETLKSLVNQLRREGYGGIHFPEATVSKDPNDLNETYGYAWNCYGDTLFENDYFDHARFNYDVEQYITSQFPGCKVIIKWTNNTIEVIRNAE